MGTLELNSRRGPGAARLGVWTGLLLVAAAMAGCVFPNDFDTRTEDGVITQDTVVDTDMPSSEGTSPCRPGATGISPTCATTDLNCCDADNAFVVCGDQDDDEQVCGACGQVCDVAAELYCDQGSCQACNDTLCALGGGQADCVDLSRDDNHCGACGAACGTGERCVEGQCTLEFTQVAAGGQHTCALTDPQGVVYCWGDNASNQISPVASDTTVPQAITLEGLGLDNCPPGRVCAKAISAGEAHTCAVTQPGDVICWGGDNVGGQLGTTDATWAAILTADPDTSRFAELPGDIPIVDLGDVRFTRVSAGRAHTCGVTSDGELWCWGLANDGQVGHTTDPGPAAPAPVEVGAVNAWLDVAAGSDHTCAVTQSLTQSVYCWGRNDQGQVQPDHLSPSLTCLGGDTSCEPTQVLLGSGGTPAAVATGHRHSCVLTDDDRVICWGQDDERLGHNNTNGSPEDIGLGPDPLLTVTAGGAFTCVAEPDVNATASVFCFGANEADQLGGSDIFGATLASVDGLTGALRSPARDALDAGARHACAILGQGEMVCWGNNDSCQLGSGECGDTQAVRVAAP